MVKKNLSDLIQEESNKTTQGESTIDVTASEVKEVNKVNAPSDIDLEATVKELQESLNKTQKNEETLRQQAKEFESTIAKQDKLFKQLQKEVEEAKKLGNLQDTVEELKQELKTARENEKSLEKLIGELQLTLQEKDALTEKLTTELYAAKKDALQLAEANTKLTAEINTAQKFAAKQPPAKQPLPKQRVPNEAAMVQPKKDYSSTLSYRKSYSRPTGPLTGTQPQESDTSAPMWLLD
ncbi:MAG: hypothetical protein VKN72_24710 [Nostocales cyanobacterium 94392]|nr:hypothetical protein [Nostocales cyanobacterium 94392]